MAMPLLEQPTRVRGWTELVAMVWLVGVGALICDYLQLSWPLIVGARTLFATAVCATLWLTLIPRARCLAGTSQAELYSLTRLVSRWVYILMYGLAIVRVSLNLYDASHQCFLCSATAATGPVRSLDDFQFYIACCVVPLWLVRAIALTVPFKPVRATTTCPPPSGSNSLIVEIPGSG